LVRAGGEPPSSLSIKDLEIDIAPDGTWSGKIEMQGPFSGMSIEVGGKWSLADSVVRYTSRSFRGTSRPRFESGRLVLDPDFIVRKDGTAEVTGEYERVDG
jgi:hypothetical protein